MYANGRPKPLLREDLVKIGNWIDAQMKAHDVWVVLMPMSEVNSDFMLSITTQSNWRTAFMDNYQFLMFDSETPQGRQLFNNILNKTAKLPI